MPSIRSQLFKKILAFLVRSRIDTQTLNVPKIRAETEKLAKLRKRPAGLSYEPIKIQGLQAEWISSNHSGPVILFIHGGGYLFGSINTHRTLAAGLAEAIQGLVLLFNYRLAPEHRFPAALDDTLAIYQSLIKEIDPKKLVLAGDSTGGGLVLAALLSLRDQKLPLPAAGVCLSPWTDLACTGETLLHSKETDPLVISQLAPVAAKLYLGDVDPKNPLASPLYGNFEGLPPLFIQVGSSELLLDDSTRLADHARRAGVDVTLDIWPDMFHGWQLCLPYIPESGKAITKIAAFISKATK
ncbi:MAG: alpha/beta hydrolase [Parachlamydia sp.]|nr:alpha/beta hydrolase [Parachlamydia sp.]